MQTPLALHWTLISHQSRYFFEKAPFPYCCHPAQRAAGDLHGRLDSVGEAEGVSETNVAFLPRERSDLLGKTDSSERSESERRRSVAFLPGERSDPLGKTDSVAGGGGVSISERCLFARRANGDSLHQ